MHICYKLIQLKHVYVIFRYSYDMIEGCRIYLEYFANSTSNFTQCAIRNARPIRMCERCVDYYLDVLKTHEDIYKVWRIKVSFWKFYD